MGKQQHQPQNMSNRLSMNGKWLQVACHTMQDLQLLLEQEQQFIEQADLKFYWSTCHSTFKALSQGDPGLLRPVNH